MTCCQSARRSGHANRSAGDEFVSTDGDFISGHAWCAQAAWQSPQQQNRRGHAKAVIDLFEVIKVNTKGKAVCCACLRSSSRSSFPRACALPTPVRGVLLACWASLPPLWRRDRRAPGRPGVLRQFIRPRMIVGAIWMPDCHDRAASMTAGTMYRLARGAHRA